ncbi:hypothetical protein MAA_00866 [Metarhizium robertsii ARSEF 23]|uniref:Uncharacterized protein n=1 Tax=Metarhizium robertsii (strain ARSEF 23 / ATCC MYA-3075) TaxID=655844 RepID=E9EJA6_METRA|nr:uncharacterized protein MAA_00866 [Metarhizium robertsii ARSEF 23]EFZ03792.2 hypothetical protein MAA_00866 [Metarhizium robertsii ARSEF 23]
MSWYMHTYFVGLAAVGYDALWGSLVKNGTATAFGAVKASGTLPDGNLLQKVYTKIPFLDQFLLSPVIFYDALLRDRNPVYRSLLVSLFSTMQTTAFCTIAHGWLGGSPRLWWNIIESLLWGVFNQSYGAAFVYPLYCFAHLHQLKNEGIKEKNMKKLSTEDAEALLYTSIVAAVLPAWLIYPAFVSCSSETRQFLIASYRTTPTILALAQPVIAVLIKRCRRIPLDGSYIGPLVKGSLYLSGACSALGHLYALATSLALAPVTLTGIFWPWTTSMDISSISVIAQGCHLFLQNDWWVILAAFVPQDLVNFIVGRYAGMPAWKTFGGLAALAVVFSLGAVLAWTMAAKV